MGTSQSHSRCKTLGSTHENESGAVVVVSAVASALFSGASDKLDPKRANGPSWFC